MASIISDSASRNELNELRIFLIDNEHLDQDKKDLLQKQVLNSNQEWNTEIKRKFAAYKEPRFTKSKIINQNRMYERELIDRNTQLKAQAARVPDQYRHNFT